MSTLPDELLQEYASDALRLGSMAEIAALQARSPDMRQIFAYGASKGKLGVGDLVSRVLVQDFRGLDPAWLAKLARVCGLQDLHEDDSRFALTALGHANRFLNCSPAYRRFHLLEIELLMEQRKFEQAEFLLEKNLDLRRATEGYIRCDLKNPFLRADDGLYDKWIGEFNKPFENGGLSPVSVSDGDSRPFDRLSANGAGELHGTNPGSPLVSVVMTTYRPERHTLLAAVNSILEQTWQRLELLIVDDASPIEFQSILDEVEGLDDRIRVHRLAHNGGTYAARNMGMRLARGSLLAGQDSDDWSHPERIRAQVDYLGENPDSPGVITSALKTDEDLVMTWRGRDPRRPCEVSLMVRRELVDQVGGYMPARKAADSEYRMRISAAASIPVGRLKAPLYLVRVLPNSLSRGDFLPGWTHPSRLGFKRAYMRWHETAPTSKLLISAETPVGELEVPIPGRFQIVQPGPPEVDVAYVADWRGDEGVQRAALEEMELMVASGLRVGIVQVDSWKYCRERMGPITGRVQDGINARKWSLLRMDEAAQVGLIVVRDPRTVQFMPAEPSLISAKSVLFVVDESPGPGEVHAFDVHSCAENAQQLFGAEPVWGAARAGRPALERMREQQVAVLDQTIPYVLSDEQWVRRPRTQHKDRPVIGRHARVLDQAWPEDAETIQLLWPREGGQDVWIRGSADDALATLDVSDLPSAWVVFAHRDLPARAFLNAIDFYVPTFTRVTPHEVREVFEAIASGCIAILPDVFRPLLGKAAIYANPPQVADQIRSLWGSPAAMDAHRRSAAAVLRRQLVPNVDFVQLIQSVLSNEESSDKSGEFVASNI